MKIIFYNPFNCGDLHVSRGIIQQIIAHVHKQDPTIEFVYSHRNDPALLSDIPNLSFDEKLWSNVNQQDSITKIGDAIYVNTWYDQQHQKYARACGILTFDILYAILDEACQKIWQFSLHDISSNPADFFPFIDYEKCDIGHVKTWLTQHSETKILVGNGEARSGQAHNFAMAPIISSLAERHPDKTFILSKQENYDFPPNVVYTTDIIQKQGSDLNEISFLSTHCDVIIGRASGVFTFAMVRKNLFERKTKFICFSHLMSHQSKFWIGKLLQERVNYSSNMLVSGTSNTNEVFDIINRSL